VRSSVSYCQVSFAGANPCQRMRYLTPPRLVSSCAVILSISYEGTPAASVKGPLLRPHLRAYRVLQQKPDPLPSLLHAMYSRVRETCRSHVPWCLPVARCCSSPGRCLAPLETQSPPSDLEPSGIPHQHCGTRCVLQHNPALLRPVLPT
jgi:hypothetical protein